MDLLTARSVPAMLDHWTDLSPDKTAIRFVKNLDPDPETWTFAELRSRAMDIAKNLQSGGTKPFDRAFLIYPQGLEFIAAYLGCLYAGIIPVPLIPPYNAKHIAKLMRVFADCEPRLILCDKDFISAVKNTGIDQADQILAISIATENLTASSEELRTVDIDRESIAFLQYTSGSTGHPKGVMVSHGNLLTNGEMIKRGYGITENTSFISWAPHYHDMGLIGGVLKPVFNGCELTLMSPTTFLEDPYVWLKSIDTYKGNVAGGPNFTFELCIKRVNDEQVQDLDLSSLRALYNGAEPIKHSTLENFSKKFAPAGFKREIFATCYGLAESTLLISGDFKASAKTYTLDRNDLEEKGKVTPVAETDTAKVVVSCGPLMDLQDVRIVDPKTHQELPNGQIGEIWIHGPHVTMGYWNNSAETLFTHKAKLAGVDDKRFLRTGDIGYLNGEDLVMTGRIKDMIIINGRNIYPQDLEETAEQAADIVRNGCVAAYSGDGLTEQIAIIAEVRESKSADYKKSADLIRQNITADIQVPVNRIVFIEAKSIPKTSSGKIQRKLAKGLLAKGKLKVLFDSKTKSVENILSPAPKKKLMRKQLGVETVVTKERQETVMTTDDVMAFLRTWVSGATNLPENEISTVNSFADLGLESSSAFELQSEIKRHFKIELGERAIFEYNDIKRLAAHIEVKLQQRVAK